MVVRFRPPLISSIVAFISSSAPPPPLYSACINPIVRAAGPSKCHEQVSKELFSSEVGANPLNTILQRVNLQWANWLSSRLMCWSANVCPSKRIGVFYFFSHRAFAAFAAIWERFLGASFAALAAPPLSPPRRPRATAWGFLGGSSGFVTGCDGSYFGASPMDSRKT
jgi:hypothetical protein